MEFWAVNTVEKPLFGLNRQVAFVHPMPRSIVG
jgi:hypothetical protein